MSWSPPAVPVSCGAILLDERGRLLILRPTYKSGWTIPGGIMEADGETPWEGCRREVREETGLVVDSGRLVVVDTKAAKEHEPLAIRFLFHCGTVPAKDARRIRLQEEEIGEHRWAPVDEALDLLRKRVRRRVAVGLQADGCVYLEDGRPVDGVRA
ncbi:NUDIX domain-containing protein [Arsenicicoccus dermatophilus]|uniref:NUDIX domain-containing protein n=1 Tax=Arsenicicoccus dermatophilus TaxID=1076331 RepID=UPI001F4C8C56|nr:NUDIX hydrolase [Arsenicicoccus dermatophilus]MCH8611798.1 NUDIX hydrolase [Arsenicicoccus dermatophilus]